MDTIVIDPPQSATHAFICLHGLGASSDDFVDFARLFQNAHRRFIFPNAPVIPITVNMGMPMSAWYDLSAMALERRVDFDGITQSINTVHSLVDAQITQGIAPEHIVLAGFSQGAVIALHAALSYPKPLSGALVMSGYTPYDHLSDILNPANTKLPILWLHGTEDPIVPIVQCREACQKLESIGVKPHCHEFPVEHTVPPAALPIIQQWLDAL